MGFVMSLLEMPFRFGPGLNFDFGQGAGGGLPAGATWARASNATYIEGQNYIRNPSASGSVAGTPGTNPTNWGLTGGPVSNISRTIIGTGVESGIPYIDVRYFGTSNAANNIGCNFDAYNV